MKSFKTNAKDNIRLIKLVEADQNERKIENYRSNELKVAKNDKRRRVIVEKMIRQNKIQTGLDYFNVALIYQHGDCLDDYQKAQSFSKQSIDLGEERGKWLYAAATDRMLVNQGKKQIYGTQYHTVFKTNRSGKTEKKMEMNPYDKRTSDKTRAKYNVPPLKKLLAMEKIHSKRLYGR